MNHHDPITDGANDLDATRRYTEGHLIASFVVGGWFATSVAWLIAGWM